MTVDYESALNFMLSDPRGRQFLWEFLGTSGAFSASFTGDPLTTAFREGKRDLGLSLLRGIPWHMLGVMDKEATERDELKPQHQEDEFDD